MSRFTTLVVSAVSTLALGLIAGFASPAGPATQADLDPTDSWPVVSLVESDLLVGAAAAGRTGNWCC